MSIAGAREGSVRPRGLAAVAGLVAVAVATVLALAAAPSAVSAACTWQGGWDTRISGDPQPMRLTQTGGAVSGVYAGDRRIFNAIAEDQRLTGNWQSPKDGGRFAFTLDAACTRFTGTWGFGNAIAGGGMWDGVRATAAAPPPTVEELATGLLVPWSLAFAPDGRLFVAQQPCRISVLDPAEGGFGPPRDVLTLPECVDVGDALRGLTLAPDFATSGNLYVVYTYRTASGPLATRVARLTEVDGALVDEQSVLDGIPGGEFHTAGRVELGPDGKLYLATGDGLDTSLPQDPASLGGKVLRFNPDGSAPSDNPTPGSYIYSLGHRNPQGLAWHPLTGDLFIVDHGPSPTIAGEPFTRGHDEIDRVVPGGNYGWPLAAGFDGDPRFIRPVLESGGGAWAPSSALFYNGDRLSAWKGSFFYGALIGSHLGRVVLQGPEYRTVVTHEKLLQGVFGRIRATAQGPDGYLYFVTSNTDGRSGAQARPGDDRLLRVVALPTLQERWVLVTEAYRTVLGRDPDPAGLDYWTYTTLTRAALEAELRQSDEYRRRQGL